MSASICKQMKLEIIKLIQMGKLSELIILCTHYNITESLKEIYHEKSGDNLMSYACRLQNVDLVEFLHKTCTFDLEQSNFDGKRAIHEAAQFENYDCLKYLIKSGVTVNAIKKADWTPLMLACTKTNLKVIEELIHAEADMKLQNKDGWNCFHIACREGDLKIVSYLHKQSSELAKTVSKNGRTPLHTAALHGHTAVVEYLLTHGQYEADSRDSCGTTPLMDAIRADFIDAARLLITKQGANVAAADNMGRQCIHLAAQAGSLNSMQYLLEEHTPKVCVSAPTIVSGVTPLHLACKEGKHLAAELLLSHKADVKVTDKKGRSALHLASGCQHTKCVALLLKHKALDIPDHSGMLAKDLAKKAEVLKLFNEMVEFNS